MKIRLEEAYDEACRALGETVVRERLLGRRVEQLERAAATPPPSDPEPGGPLQSE